MYVMIAVESEDDHSGRVSASEVNSCNDPPTLVKRNASQSDMLRLIPHRVY
jgi:hypothetical protein